MREYLTQENSTDSYFFPPLSQNVGGTFSSFVCFLYTPFGGESHRGSGAGNSFEIEAKTEASRGGLVSVLVHVYM